MYDYSEAMTEDVKQWIADEVDLADWTEDRGGLEQQLNDDLWTADSVTGNGSGSYTFNRVQASLYVLDNMDLLQKAINEFATDPATVGDKFISEDYLFLLQHTQLDCLSSYRTLHTFPDSA